MPVMYNQNVSVYYQLPGSLQPLAKALPEVKKSASVKSTSKIWKSQLKEHFDRKYKGDRTEIKYVSKECPRGGFMSTVYCRDIGYAEGEGPTKAAAEHNAAYNALKKLDTKY